MSVRSRLHRKKQDDPPLDSITKPDDTFYDVNDLDTISTSSMSTSFDNSSDKLVYEEHLTKLQEQLVSVMIENQTLVAELRQYHDNETNEKLRQDLLVERNKTKSLEVQLRKNQGRRRQGSEEDRGRQPLGVFPDIPTDDGAQPEVAEEAAEEPGRSRLDRLWETAVDRLYDLLEDCSEITRPEQPKPEVVEPLTVKKLKENIKRFRVAIKPYMDTLKGFYNLVSWKSRSYTFIVLLVYMYSVWRGWFLPLIFFLAALRIAVNFLHSKNFKFRFAYFDPGEVEQETEDTLGISDRFNLVLQVATKVQNGLGTAADSLEKIKNLLTWRHPEGTRKVFVMLCLACVLSAVLPTAYLWKFIGIGLGIKIFLVNYVYNKYPRIKQRYDSNQRLWEALPTDAQYDRQFVRAEMDKYIMVPRDGEEREIMVGNEVSDSDSSEDEESEEFRQLFMLPPSEHPLRGWAGGKRTVLIGKERSLMALLTKKRGKLYLTKSFLCFEREKVPSPRNIMIPLADIVAVDKVKINQRLPGRGMSMQIAVSSEGKDNVLLFGGIIGREDVVQGIRAAMHAVKRQGVYIRSRSSLSSLSTSSGGSQNFTFAANYEDSE